MMSGESGSFILSLLPCSGVTLYPESGEWQLGALPGLCRMNTQDLQMPNLEVWQLLNFTKFGFLCLFVCLFTTSGYTHTHTRTREYAFWSVGFAMVGTHVRSRFPGHLAWSPYREMVFGACRNPNSVLLQVTPTLGAQLWMRQIHKQFPTQRLRSRGDSESQHGLPPQASSGFRSRARPQNEGAHSCRSRVAHTVTGSR